MGWTGGFCQAKGLGLGKRELRVRRAKPRPRLLRKVACVSPRTLRPSPGGGGGAHLSWRAGRRRRSASGGVGGQGLRAEGGGPRFLPRTGPSLESASRLPHCSPTQGPPPDPANRPETSDLRHCRRCPPHLPASLDPSSLGVGREEPGSGRGGGGASGRARGAGGWGEGRSAGGAGVRGR